MLAHTKKHPTETVQLFGSPEVINRVRKYAIEVGAVILDAENSIAASDLSPELNSNPAGLYLRGVRVREDMTQEKLANLTGITRSNISAMEHGKRPIGKETAKKLASVLKCDYRRFL